MSKFDWKKAAGFLKKYAYVLLILAVGAVLIFWPSSAKGSAPQEKTEEKEAAAISGFDLAAAEEKLRALLESMDAVGRAEVALSVTGTGEVVYRENVRTYTDGSEERTTVTVSDGSGRTRAVEVTTLYPRFTGCVVVCEGAGSDAVRLSVKEAVMSLTGLSADKIAVIKMR